MKVIMNPPYKIHLKVLDAVIAAFPDSQIVNLSPILELEFPSAPNPEVCSCLQSLEVIPKETAQKLFSRNPTDLGIWVLEPSKPAAIVPDPFSLRGIPSKVAWKVFNKIKDFRSFEDVKKGPMKGWSVVYSHMNGLGPHKFVYHDNVAPNGKTYRELVRNQHKNDFPRTHFEFSTKDKAEKFIKWVSSDLFKFIEKITQPGLLRVFSTLPHCEDCNDWWAEFNLTPEEVNIIKNEVKQ